VATLSGELEAFTQEMVAPGFWDNQLRAREVTQTAERHRKTLDEYNSIKSQVEDMETLLELSGEDPGLVADVEAEIDSVDQALTSLELRAYLDGPYDANDCYLSINAGAGGTEAQDWAEMLLRMYTRYLEEKGYRFEIIEVSLGDVAGIKSATIEIDFSFAYGYLKSEHGVHRLVRISPFDSNQRRHTSFAAVNVVPQIDDEEGVEISEDDLRIDTYRSSGAGGQHVNTTDSAVRVTHLPTGIVTASQKERSQHQNKDIAMRMLRARLVELELRKREQELKGIQGDLKAIEWGSQIRSYVFQPYQLVKDLRTEIEVGNIQSVMDGNLDLFIEGFLSHQKR